MSSTAWLYARKFASRPLSLTEGELFDLAALLTVLSTVVSYWMEEWALGY